MRGCDGAETHSGIAFSLVFLFLETALTMRDDWWRYAEHFQELGVLNESRALGVVTLSSILGEVAGQRLLAMLADIQQAGPVDSLR